jgi:macrodomain Ter protein organizer (MatP/YcbG family)
VAITAGKSSVAKKPQITEYEGYCRMCHKILPSAKFYETTNPRVDKNGLMSVCRDHCAEIYESYFSIHNNLEIALQLTCQELDVCFNQQALKETKSHIEGLLTKGKKAEAVFGYYKSKLMSTGKNNAGLESFRYKDSDLENNIEKNMSNKNENEIEQNIDEDKQIFWGKKFPYDDIEFLEIELANWKKTHKCDNQAELTLLKEICITILEIRKEREEGKSTKELKKELQELMKTASVDPAKANAISGGQTVDRFGVWLKDIEEKKPSEWWQDQEKYKDMDGFIPYIKNYIVRPIKNFFTGSKDFMINGEDLGFNEEESNG